MWKCISIRLESLGCPTTHRYVAFWWWYDVAFIAAISIQWIFIIASIWILWFDIIPDRGLWKFKKNWCFLCLLNVCDLFRHIWMNHWLDFFILLNIDLFGAYLWSATCWPHFLGNVVTDFHCDRWAATGKWSLFKLLLIYSQFFPICFPKYFNSSKNQLSFFYMNKNKSIFTMLSIILINFQKLFHLLCPQSNTDERLRRISELLMGIKVIKLNAWEKVFREKIEKSRENELKCLDMDSIYWTLMSE